MQAGITTGFLGSSERVLLAFIQKFHGMTVRGLSWDLELA